MQFRQFDNDYLVCYHHPCLDGAVAAWSAYQKLGAHALYFGVDHNRYDQLAAFLQENLRPNHYVYFLDFAPPIYILEQTLEVAEHVTVLDHHISSQDLYQGLVHSKLQTFFDMNRSGAGLAWDYFMGPAEKPDFLKMVQAIDLRHEDYLQDYDLFFNAAAYLDQLDLTDFQVLISEISKLQAHDVSDMAALGAEARQKNVAVMENVMESCEYAHFSFYPELENRRIPFVNARITDMGREFSQILLKYCDEKPKIGIAWSEDVGGLYKMNIRSDGFFSAHKLAEYLVEHYGVNGGGHVHSAVARFDEVQFKKIKSLITML